MGIIQQGFSNYKSQEIFSHKRGINSSATKRKKSGPGEPPFVSQTLVLPSDGYHCSRRAKRMFRSPYELLMTMKLPDVTLPLATPLKCDVFGRL